MGLAHDGNGQAMTRDARWNWTVNLLSNAFFSLALSFVFGSTVLTLYASHLTRSAVLIGIVPSIQGIMTVLPQLLMSRQTERLPVKKKLFAKVNILERVPYLWIGLLILFVPGMPPMASYWILVLSLMLAWAAGSLGRPEAARSAARSRAAVCRWGRIAASLGPTLC